MISPEDHRLKERFANLREVDRRAAPEFGRIAAASSASLRRGFAWRIALAAAPVLALLAIFVLRTQRSADAAPRELANWSSPTAFLLETPGKQLLNQTPRLGEPLFNALPAYQDGPK